MINSYFSDCHNINEDLNSFFNPEINSYEEFSISYFSVDNKLFISAEETEKQLKTAKGAVRKLYQLNEELKEYAQYIFIPEQNKRILCFNAQGIFIVSMNFNSDYAVIFRKNIMNIYAKLLKKEFNLNYQAGYWQGKIAMRNEYQAMK